jgi:hypothetical protein
LSDTVQKRQIDLTATTLGAALKCPAFSVAQEGETRLLVVYRNWKGEVGERVIIPRRLWFGSTQWHPEPQWLLDAEDVSKGVARSFSTKDFLAVTVLND